MRCFLFGLFAALPISAGTLIFLQAPPLEVVQDSSVTLRLAPAPGQSVSLVSCGVYAAELPSGSQISGHARLPKTEDTVSAQPPSLQISFTPSEGSAGAQLSLGVHYLVAACQDGASVSPEFPIRIATTRGATLLSPQAQETSVRPEISWTTVPGVPAYHVLLSDQPLSIDANAGTVSGASVIWQAIVSGDRIVYGDPDPSGNFNKVAPPPLAPNIEYNLVVLNNYDGKSALNTSTRAQALKLFTLKPQAAPLSAPKVLAPSRGTSYRAPADSVIPFRWSASRASGRSANTYRLYVYAAETQQGVTVLRPIWQTEGTDTTASLKARGVLLKARYVTKVFALADDGSGSVSDTVSFHYDAEVQTMKLGARKAGLSGDTARLGGARIVATALDGSGSSLPLFTLSDALLSVDFALGRYRMEFSAEGCDPLAVEQTLSGGSAVNVDPVLPASPSRIQGIAVDSQARAISNVEVTAAGTDGTPTLSQTDAQGRFLLGARPGATKVSLRKDNYQTRDTVFIAENGKTYDLGKVVLQKASAFLSGTVRTSTGAVLPATTVEVRDSLGKLLRQLITNAQGGFSLFLPVGSYGVSAMRAGYTGQPQTVKLRDAAEVSLTLTPGASVVKVVVRQTTLLASGSAKAALEGATVTLQSVKGGAGVSAKTDVNGAAALSVADTGDYWLTAAHPEAYPDSVRVNVAQPKSTVESALDLLRYASLSGKVRLQPDSLVDPAAVRISLLPAAGGAAVAAVSATPATPDTLGRLAFSLEHVAVGTYTLTTGLAGYFPAFEPTVVVTQGRRNDTLSLILRRVASQAAFRLRRNNADLPGTIRLRVPINDAFAAGSKRPLGAGTFVLDAEPQDSSVLPLRGFTVRLPATPGLDTTVDLPFPARHDPALVRVANGSVVLPIQLDQNADSGTVAYSSIPGTWDTLRLPGSRLPLGTDSAVIPAPARGGVFSYAFSLRFGNRTYGQGTADVPFRVELPRDSGLGELHAAQGDSLLLPSGGRCRVTLRALSSAGDGLDASVARLGQVRFRLSPGFPGLVESSQGLSAVVRADRIASAAASAKTTGKAAAAWDTLYVTVTYTGRTASLAVPLRVDRLQAQRLRLVSLAGDLPFIPSPQSVPLQVTAYDTSTSPPTPVLANPEFTLNPPEAGTVDELGVLRLDTAFIGPVRVYARHAREDGALLQAELFQERDSILRGISVGQTLRVGAAARRFFHTRGVEVLSPDSAFPAGGLLRFVPHRMARTFASLRSASLEGRAYELSNPTAAVLAKPLEIRLAPPPSRNAARSAIRRFDAARFKWFDLSDTGRGQPNGFGQAYVSARFDTLDGQYYGLFTASEPLGLSLFEVVPNPFSPRVTAARDGNVQPGTRIRFRPESDSSAEVTVSLRVYNQGGEPVRAIANYRTFSKLEAEVYWDGLDDRGRKVRNGRYMLCATLTPTGGGKTKSIVRPVVVFE